MATKTQPPAPFSRFSRIGFGLTPKFNSAAARPRKNKQGGVEEEWYIPYNGPYEPPPEAPRNVRERDSWGDVVLEPALDDVPVLSSDLHKRHGGQHDTPAEDSTRGAWKNGNASSDDDKKKGTRSRTQSVVSGRTVSSGTADHSRSSVPQQRRSTISSTHRPPVMSYINLDASGGVGESPMPQNRASKEGSSTQRSSLFTFGQTRKVPQASISRKLSRPPRSSSGLGIEHTAGHNPTKHRRSSSAGSGLSPDIRPLQPRRGNMVPLDPRRSDDEDYYHSYYSTLISTPGPDQSQHAPQPPPVTTGFTFPTTSSPHPYARVHEKPEAHAQPDLPRLTFTDASLPLQGSTSADAAYPSAPQPFIEIKRLKNSASTPDFRIASNLPFSRTKRFPSRPSGFKDRWLSAETWCDAVLFPRPRLRVKQLDQPGFAASGRIVSPPGSPLPRSFVDTGIEPPGKGKGLASRVLVHSRSLADLRKASMPEAGPSSIPDGAIPSVQGDLPPPERSAIPRPPRPRSFAQDDMSLVPSLARVLEEGQLLDDQRKEWQAQATQSFQNKLSRNVSRARSKSLTHRGRRKDEPPPSSIDILAARACLGSQSMVPNVSLPRSQDPSSTSRHGGSSRGTFSHVSHSHSTSLSKTLSKSSRSHSQTHSRTDSWGKSALKVAKSAACGIACNDVSEAPAETSGLEGALRRDDTKVIRLADPANIPVDKGTAVDGATAASVSPVPSASSDMAVGIALSTPPIDDVPGPIRLPGHPYAQGGLYTYRTYVPSIDSRPEQGSDYAGPHPSLTAGQSSTNEVASRHRNPPLPVHPYAQASRDSFFEDARIVPQPRMDSDVPPPAKMWAQWSPGVVREILPNEIQYSPFLPDRSARNSKNTNDTMGMGSALAYAVRPQRSKDSGLGTSEDHTVITEWELSQRQAVAVAKRSNRQPVQYDATRPSYLSQSQKSPDPSSSHTAAPSLPVPLTPPDLRNMSTSADDVRATTASPVTTSASSSSPRPFGNPDDLDGYHDLFYQPRSKEYLKDLSDEPVASTSVTWEDRLDRPGSDLTSLARQLSQEFHQLSAEHDRESYYSRASMAVSQHSAFFRRPTDSGLELVFEEVSQSESPDGSPLVAFHPSINIPEDVSRSSVHLDPEEDEDETEVYRVGIVESTSTPPATTSDHRSSFTGDMSYAHEQLRHPPDTLFPQSPSGSRVNSGLHPTSSNPTRSSFLTTSSVSRMSGLSDFPAPPKHTSILSSFFDEALSQTIGRSSPPPLPLDEPNRRLTFGGTEDVEELLTALSSQASHSSLTHTQHS